MSKQLMFSHSALENLHEGVSKLAQAVKVTMGPNGGNVILQKSFGSPRVTKDGVSVSKEIELPQPFENIGAKLINQVASKTSDEVGDGTTTATVLAEAIFQEGLKAVSSGADPMALKRGIDLAVRAAVGSIGNLSIKVRSNDDLARVATIASNGDEEIGKLLAEAEPHLLHAHFGPMGLLAAPLSKRSGIPLVCTFYGYDLSSLLRCLGISRNNVQNTRHSDPPRRRPRAYSLADLYAGATTTGEPVLQRHSRFSGGWAPSLRGCTPVPRQAIHLR